MTALDHDLASMQEARDLATAAHRAQKLFAAFDQAAVDRVCAAMAEAAYQQAGRLGLMAHEETGFGIPEHKRLKNEFAGRGVWERVKHEPTVGVIERDESRGLIKIGWPMGVVAALSPSTNPTSTVIYKTIISVKARNGIVHAPHPSAVACCGEAVRVMAEAGMAAGMPEGLVSSMAMVSLEGTGELMKHREVAVILATGGTPMVRAAHSMGKPAYGVGPGNVPCYVDRSADVERAASYIVSSKSFDNSVICATEQAVVADRPIAVRLAAEMEALGAYFVDEEQARALGLVLFDERGGFNPRSVGQTPQKLARMAGISVPDDARILVARLDGVGPGVPLSREKLTTVLGWYEVDGWEEGCRRSLELLAFGGEGHTQIIHASDVDVILRFGLEKPAFRVLVNTMGTLGAIGLTTGLAPAFTLAPGGIGGAITGDNITVRHLLNVKHLAGEICAPPAAAMVPGARVTRASAAGLLGGLAEPRGSTGVASPGGADNGSSAAGGSVAGGLGTGGSGADIDALISQIVQEIRSATAR